MANDHPIAAMATYEQSLSNTRYWHFDMARKAIDGIRNFSLKNKKFFPMPAAVCAIYSKANHKIQMERPRLYGNYMVKN